MTTFERDIRMAPAMVAAMLLIAGPVAGSPVYRLAEAAGTVPAVQEPDLLRETVAPDSDLFLGEDRKAAAEAFARFATGITLEVNRQPEEALEQFFLSAMADPANTSLALDVSRRLIRGKKDDKALELLTRCSETGEATGEIHALLGFMLARQGKHEEAIAATRKAVADSPGELQPYQYLSQILLEAGQPEEAFKVLQEASAKVAPSSINLIRIAELILNLKDRDEDLDQKVVAAAVRLLESVEEMKPESRRLLEQLALAFRRLESYGKSIGIYQRLLKEFPNALELREQLGSTYFQAGELERAGREFEAVVTARPDHIQGHFVLYQIAVETKDYQDAEEHLSRAVVLRPDAEPLYYQLARLQTHLDMAETALKTLDKARSRFQGGFDLEYQTAAAYNRMKNYAKATQHFTNAEIQASAEEPEKLDRIFYFEAGATHERNQDYEQAENFFRKCLKLAPEFPDALNYLGYMWTEQGVNLEEAKDLIEQAVKLEPENAAFLDSLAWVLYKLGQPKPALENQLKAVELTEEPDPVLFDHLGDIYAALEMKGKARKAWKRALELDPDDEDIRAKLENSQSKTP